MEALASISAIPRMIWSRTLRLLAGATCLYGTASGLFAGVADAALIASLSSTCSSAETIVQLVVMTLSELQILQL